VNHDFMFSPFFVRTSLVAEIWHRGTHELTQLPRMQPKCNDRKSYLPILIMWRQLLACRRIACTLWQKQRTIVASQASQLCAAVARMPRSMEHAACIMHCRIALPHRLKLCWACTQPLLFGMHFCTPQITLGLHRIASMVAITAQESVSYGIV